MTDKKINGEILNNLYKNAHIALQSINDLNEELTDEKFKKELKEEYEGYEKIIGEISSLMKSNGIEPKDIGTFKKMMLKASVKMNTAKSDNRSDVAEMMIKGTVMGITDIYRELDEQKDIIAPEVKELATKLASLEEGYEERLKQYL